MCRSLDGRQLRRPPAGRFVERCLSCGPQLTIGTWLADTPTAQPSADDQLVALRRATWASVSFRSAAAAESVIDDGREAPGMGMTTSACARCQASVTRYTDTPSSSATSANAGAPAASAPAAVTPPNGLHGRNANPTEAQCASSPAEER